MQSFMKRFSPVWCLAISLVVCAVSAPASAVLLDSTNACTVKLRDGTDVVLYGEFVSKIGRRSADAGEDELAPAVPPSRLRNTLTPVIETASAVTSRGPDADRARARRDEKAAQLTSLRSKLRAPSYTDHVKSNKFYYLPPGNSLHLSKRPNGTPEFLFVKYTSDDKGGAQGGLLHFLMEWSLTKKQEAELRRKVASDCTVDGKKGELISHVPLDEGTPQGSFKIISATLSDDTMTRSMVQSGHAPTMPGGKIAAAANLSKDGAQLFLATVEDSKSIADLSVELDFTYLLMMPAAKGEIIFHWDQFQERQEEYEKEVTKTTTYGRDWCVWFVCKSSKKDTYSEDEIHSVFDTMVENKFVELNFEGYNPDSPYTQQILEAMLQYFKNAITMPPPEGSFGIKSDEDGKKPGEQADGDDRELLSVNYEALSQKFAVKEERIRLNAGLAVRKPIQVVGNMASWYNNVKDNRSCVQEVNLNDPFFEHRDLRFILDLDAKEIFDDVVNYVTINARKKRLGDNDFTDSVTIDSAFLEEKGIAASMSYARLKDRGSESYDYQVQWSLRGGNLYPANPRWQKGRWEGVTLSPPVERWQLELEGDIDLMDLNQIARVTAEIHYPLFGKEQTTIMALSPARGQPLADTHIYVDRGTKGFAYRLIINHKTEGRMVLPWETRIGERYVWANLPEEILTESAMRAAAKEAAAKLGEMGSEKVLDEFEELFSDAR